MNISELSPRQLFRLDRFGALYSAMMLGIVLPSVQTWFGIPLETLYVLAVLPLFFAAYDTYVLWFTDPITGSSLRIIAGLNVSYCLLSGALALKDAALLTPWGWAYLSVEIVVVLFIAWLEWKA